MNKKSIITSIISILIFSLLFGYSLVYAGTGIFNNNTNIVFKLSENIFLDSISLNKTEIIFRSGKDLENYKIKSECDIFSNLKYHNGDNYMFEIKFFNNNCENNNLILVNDKGEIEKHFTLNIVREYNALSNLLDIKTVNLIKFQNTLNKKVKLYSKYNKYDPKIEKNYYKFLEKNRLLQESLYNANLVNNILLKRKEKYIVPVSGYKLPTSAVKLPNSGRLYRDDYTDGIHHGWDIDADFGEQVIAIDDGIIVRVVSNFKFGNLSVIKKGENISDYDKVRNLDILRGNQVWLKTMKGDVIFYSHLNEIFTNIEVGEVVKKGQPLGTIGITGIPDINYKDYHLHFPIQVNPFRLDMVGKYDLDDYMNWDWMFKGKSKDYILENQSNIFQG